MWAKNDPINKCKKRYNYWRNENCSEKRGKIWKFYIKFRKNGDEGVLNLYDEGVGLPDGFDIESSTGLGMTVIKSLTTQIDGETTIVSDKGTHFKIKTCTF